MNNKKLYKVTLNKTTHLMSTKQKHTNQTKFKIIKKKE